MPNYQPADSVPPGLRAPSDSRTVTATGDTVSQPEPGNGVPGSGHGIGLMASEASGPINLGHKQDKHNLGTTLDGEPINSAHIDTNAFFYDDQKRDAPLFFEGSYPQNLPSFPLRSKVHLAYDETQQHVFVGGVKPGLWRWYAEVPYLEAPKKPEDTPQPTPGDTPYIPKRNVPGTGTPTTPSGSPGGGSEAPGLREPTTAPTPATPQKNRGPATGGGDLPDIQDPIPPGIQSLTPDERTLLPKKPNGEYLDFYSEEQIAGVKAVTEQMKPGNDGSAEGGGADDAGDGSAKSEPAAKKEKKTAADRIHAWGTIGDKTEAKKEAEEEKKAIYEAALQQAGIVPGSKAEMVKNGTTQVPAVVVKNGTPYLWQPDFANYRAATRWFGPGYGKSSGREVAGQPKDATK